MHCRNSRVSYNFQCAGIGVGHCGLRTWSWACSVLIAWARLAAFATVCRGVAAETIHGTAAASRPVTTDSAAVVGTTSPVGGSRAVAIGGRRSSGRTHHWFARLCTTRVGDSCGGRWQVTPIVVAATLASVALQAVALLVPAESILTAASAVLALWVAGRSIKTFATSAVWSRGRVSKLEVCKTLCGNTSARQSAIESANELELKSPTCCWQYTSARSSSPDASTD